MFEWLTAHQQIIQHRLLKFILKKSLGQFLKQKELEQSQIEWPTFDSILLHSLDLDVEKLEEALGSKKEKYLKEVKVEKAVFKIPFCIELEGVSVVLQRQKCQTETFMEKSLHEKMLESVHEFIQNQEEIVEELDPQSDLKNEKLEEDEGLQILSSWLDDFVSRLQLSIKNLTIDFYTHPDSEDLKGVRVLIPSLDYKILEDSDESKNEKFKLESETIKLSLIVQNAFIPILQLKNVNITKKEEKEKEKLSLLFDSIILISDSINIKNLVLLYPLLQSLIQNYASNANISSSENSPSSETQQASFHTAFGDSILQTSPHFYAQSNIWNREIRPALLETHDMYICLEIEQLVICLHDQNYTEENLFETIQIFKSSEIDLLKIINGHHLLLTMEKINYISDKLLLTIGDLAGKTCLNSQYEHFLYFPIIEEKRIDYEIYRFQHFQPYQKQTRKGSCFRMKFENQKLEVSVENPKFEICLENVKEFIIFIKPFLELGNLTGTGNNDSLLYKLTIQQLLLQINMSSRDSSTGPKIFTILNNVRFDSTLNMDSFYVYQSCKNEKWTTPLLSVIEPLKLAFQLDEVRVSGGDSHIRLYRDWMPYLKEDIEQIQTLIEEVSQLFNESSNQISGGQPIKVLIDQGLYLQFPVLTDSLQLNNSNHEELLFTFYIKNSLIELKNEAVKMTANIFKFYTNYQPVITDFSYFTNEETEKENNALSFSIKDQMIDLIVCDWFVFLIDSNHEDHCYSLFELLELLIHFFQTENNENNSTPFEYRIQCRDTSLFLTHCNNEKLLISWIWQNIEFNIKPGNDQYNVQIGDSGIRFQPVNAFKLRQHEYTDDEGEEDEEEYLFYVPKLKEIEMSDIETIWELGFGFIPTLQIKNVSIEYFDSKLEIQNGILEWSACPDSFSFAVTAVQQLIDYITDYFQNPTDMPNDVNDDKYDVIGEMDDLFFYRDRPKPTFQIKKGEIQMEPFEVDSEERLNVDENNGNDLFMIEEYFKPSSDDRSEVSDFEDCDLFKMKKGDKIIIDREEGRVKSFDDEQLEMIPNYFKNTKTVTTTSTEMVKEKPSFQLLVHHLSIHLLMYDGFDFIHSREAFLQQSKNEFIPITTSDSLSDEFVEISWAGSDKHLQESSIEMPKQETPISKNDQKSDNERDSIVLKAILENFNLQYSTFATAPFKQRIKMKIDTVKVLDYFPNSKYRHLLLPVKENDQHAAVLIMNQVRENQEWRIDIKLSPLRVWMDQDALEYLMTISGGGSNNSSPTSNDQLFIQKLTFHSLHLLIDYMPKRISVEKLKKGQLMELLNLLQLDQFPFFLPATDDLIIKGITSSKLINSLKPHLLNAVQTQVFQLPLHQPLLKPLKRVNEALQSLLFGNEPVRDRLTQFLGQVGREGVQASVGLFDLLEQFLDTLESSFGNISSITEREPRNLEEGLQEAQSVLFSRFQEAFKTLSDSMSGSINNRKMIKSILMDPIRGTSGALHRLSLGLRNQVIPNTEIKNQKKKEKPESIRERRKK